MFDRNKFGKPPAMTGGVKQLNAMQGYDATIKHDHISRNRSMTPQQAAKAYAAMLDTKNGGLTGLHLDSQRIVRGKAPACESAPGDAQQSVIGDRRRFRTGLVFL